MIQKTKYVKCRKCGHIVHEDYLARMVGVVNTNFACPDRRCLCHPMSLSQGYKRLWVVFGFDMFFRIKK